MVHILLDSGTTVAFDAFVLALLGHSDVVTLLLLPNPLHWVVILNSMRFCLLPLFLQFVCVNPTSDDISVSIEDAVAFTRCDISSHVRRYFLLVME